MVTPLIQTSFAGGELAPQLWGRTDLVKYRSGAKVLRNCYVDYRGGYFARPGSMMVGPCRTTVAQSKPCLLPFRFNDSQAYVLELNDQRMRIIENGVYQTEAPVNITAVNNGSPVVVTAPGHGVVLGDTIRITGVNGEARPNGISGLNGRFFRVAAVIGNDIRLADPFGSALSSTLWTAYAGGGQIAKVREVATPWSASILFQLKFVQQGDTMTVTHETVRSHNILRNGDGTWTIEPENFAPQLLPPTSVTVAHGGANFPTNIFTYVVTAVDLATQDESAASNVAWDTGGPLNPDATDSDDRAIVKISWSAVAGPNRAYRIYKAQVVPAITGFTDTGNLYGLIGETTDLKYYDRNYQPDFTQTPPKVNNPFANGLIVAIGPDAQGFGYLNPAAVVTDVTGSGAIVNVIKNSAGSITGYVVANGGGGYGAPSVTVVEQAYVPGTGATFSFGGTWVIQDDGTYVPDTADIAVTAGGTNYHAAKVIMTPDGCSGPGPFVPGVAYVTINNGVIVSLRFDDTYEPPNVGTDPTACGLIFDVVDQNPTSDPLSAATGIAILGEQINPAAVTYFQQRKGYAGGQRPRTFWLSRPGLFTNFDGSDPPQDDDSIEGSVVGPFVNGLLWLVPVPGGLVAGTTSGAYLISGGQGGEAITPASATADPQAINGANALQPLPIGNDILYMQARGSAVRSLAFDFYVNSLAGTDVSALSAHLLVDRTITQWVWAEEPLHMVWAVRDDGVLLSMTYVKDQQVYGWSRHDTAGRFVSVCSIPEGREDAVYVVARRIINGQWFYITERLQNDQLGGNMALGIPANIEQAWYVDSGLRYPLAVQPASIMPDIYYPKGEVGTPVIVNGGSGYPDFPTGHIADPNPDAAGAEVLIQATAGVITTVTVTNRGHGYTRPLLVIEGAGQNGVVSFDVWNRQGFSLSAALGAGRLDVGDILRVGGGVGVVLAIADTQHFVANMLQPIMDMVPNEPAGTLAPVLAEEGSWTLTTPVSIIGGLDHLNGKIVTGLADGSLVTPRQVVDGCVTLDAPATAITLGLGYSKQAQPLPPEVGDPSIQSRKKLIPQVVIRCMNTRGLLIGSTWDNLTEVKERDYQTLGQPIQLQDGGQYIDPTPGMPEGLPSARVPLGYKDIIHTVGGGWKRQAGVCVQSTQPLPLGVLALVENVELGDA